TIESAMTLVWLTIERFLAEHGAAVLVTLAEAAGSGPCEIGARIDGAPGRAVFRHDRGVRARVAGGRRGPKDLGRPWVLGVNKALRPELGQCCGGRVVITLERFEGGDLGSSVRDSGARRLLFDGVGAIPRAQQAHERGRGT